MRTKINVQETLPFSQPSSDPKVVKEYKRKYEYLDELLRSNRQILNFVLADFTRWLSQSKSGRKGAYTTEQLFRSILVMFVEQWSYRDAVVNIGCNEVLQQFVRLGMKPVMDFSFLAKAYCALSEKTWEQINQSLNGYARTNEMIHADRLRLDSTVYETNIHHPTDSSLLWDSFRTLARLMKGIRDEMREVGLMHRFHVKKVKKLAYFISRNGGSKSKRTQQKVKRTYRRLIERVRGIVKIAQTVLERLCGCFLGELEELDHYIPLVEKIINQSERRIFHGETVPADEKIYSLFEEHTELLKRGKAGKDIEFGHKILLGQSEEKYITHYQVLEKRREDPELLEKALKAHKKLFGKSPDVLAADKGFYKDREQLKKLEKEIELVSIAKKGKRTAEEEEREKTDEFKEGQRFRAGIEGSISVLKRAYKLNKCLFKGFKNFAVSVGCAIFCHNLVLLSPR